MLPSTLHPKTLGWRELFGPLGSSSSQHRRPPGLVLQKSHACASLNPQPQRLYLAVGRGEQVLKLLDDAHVRRLGGRELVVLDRERGDLLQGFGESEKVDIRLPGNREFKLPWHKAGLLQSSR